MKIINKKTGMAYENLSLERRSDKGLGYGKIDESGYMSEINLKDYVYAYTSLCENCIDASGKTGGVDGVCCSNCNCDGESKEFWEVFFTEDEILNDFEVINN